MSAHDERNPRKAGYRNPPRAGQFQKGISGNPRGRPRKPREDLELPTHRDPTIQEVIRAEINRDIPITDSRGRHTITTKHAVVRAMAATAIKGGVLAQRSYLDLAEQEEKRHQKERRKNFRFWRDYKDKWDARIAAGNPPPDDEPHPDDIKLDWRTHEVRIEGPIDKEDRAAAKVVRAYRDLAYLMAIYRDELSGMCDVDGRVSQVGGYFGIYLICQDVLWPRMRRPPQAYDKVIMRGIRLGWDACGIKLKARCEALGLPFLPRNKDAAPLMIPLAKLGIRKPITLPLGHQVLTRHPRRKRA
ncbi:MAG: DUF5681 domain-containing protein [Rhodospirillales bacterium]|nr:DUF5681 domain-containing protein [Rhodospirillales bacterium]